ncbi:MAG TPA: TetR/AcrR family transcriptional regulator [Acidimicrobiales bacterium]
MGSPRGPRDTATTTDDPARPVVAKKTATPRGTARLSAPLPTSSGPPNGDVVGAPASKRVLRSQGRRTMRKLLDAAMVAFDQRGYHATRVNDVVEIAKTSHGTFYLYFSNKEDLLRALVTEAAGEAQHLYDALNTLPAEGGAPQWDDVFRWVKAFSNLWQSYAPIFRAWTDLATIDPELVEIMRETFTAMSQALSKQIHPDSAGHVIDPDVAGMATLAMLDRFHYFLEFSGKPIDEVALGTMTTMVYRAFLDPNA